MVLVRAVAAVVFLLMPAIVTVDAFIMGLHAGKSVVRVASDRARRQKGMVLWDDEVARPGMQS
jgi:hypothetical protein